MGPRFEPINKAVCNFIFSFNTKNGCRSASHLREPRTPWICVFGQLEKLLSSFSAIDDSSFPTLSISQFKHTRVHLNCMVKSHSERKKRDDCIYINEVGVFDASPGNVDPIYRACISECENTGCVGENCFTDCYYNSDDPSASGHIYSQWKKNECQGNCRYHCMIQTEKEKADLGLGLVKYHGKWPFKCVFGMQEVSSVAFSLLNLAMHLRGWLSFYFVVYHKLPLRTDKKPYYEYCGLWHIYAFLSFNSWLWSAVFHTRDLDLTEKLDYFSAIAIIGYSLIVVIIRSFSLKNEAARVMVAAPLLAFVTTHILYLNNYKMDYGWNMKVCVIMGVSQLVIWVIWAIVSGHPSRWKVLFVVFGSFLAMILEVYDFPPYEGYIDAHALWHAATVPLTWVWWSFVKDDAHYQTMRLMKKFK